MEHQRSHGSACDTGTRRIRPLGPREIAPTPAMPSSSVSARLQIQISPPGHTQGTASRTACSGSARARASANSKRSDGGFSMRTRRTSQLRPSRRTTCRKKLMRRSRIDQCQIEIRPGNRQGDARKPCTAPEIYYPCGIRQRPGCGECVIEVDLDCVMLRRADQVDACTPALQLRNVLLEEPFTPGSQRPTQSGTILTRLRRPSPALSAEMPSTSLSAL